MTTTNDQLADIFRRTAARLSNDQTDRDMARTIDRTDVCEIMLTMAEELERARVRPDHACPKCHEQLVDQLAWIDDVRVHCLTCHEEYEPG